MTTTGLVISEIERFLKTPDPEVLCITGKWGVGKTFTWQSIFDRLRLRKEISLHRYSYVSLFGISSLEALKATIFEHMEFLSPEGRSAIDALKTGANQGFKYSKPLLDMGSLLPYIGGAISKAQPLIFSSIRNQIICVDDLERASGVSVKDVFGLISFLREQRSCKIILLLNEEQFKGESGDQFSNYFEKVVDAKLVFEPTAIDAASVALGKDDLSKQIGYYCIKLGIRNIRVIKKIERMILMVVPLIERFGSEMVKQTAHTLTLFGWCALDTGATPPPFEYVKQTELSRLMEHRANGTKPTDEESRWNTILHDYDFGSLDDFDVALANFVQRSVIDQEEIERSAKTVNAKREAMAKTGSYEKAWRVFHDSFADNEDEVCTALVDGFKNSFDVLTRRNLDEVVSILRALGRNNSAGELIKCAETKGDKDFWTSDDVFNRTIKDDEIRTIKENWDDKEAPVFEFENDLVRAASNPRDDLMSELASVSVERYEGLFESKTGDDFRRVIGAAMEFRRYGNPTDSMRAVVQKAEEALRRIGAKSVLNELRVRVHGVAVKQISEKREA